MSELRTPKVGEKLWVKITTATPDEFRIDPADLAKALIEIDRPVQPGFEEEVIPVEVLELGVEYFSVTGSRDSPYFYFYACFENETWIQRGFYTLNGFDRLDGKVELFQSDPRHTGLIPMTSEVLSTEPKVVQIIMGTDSDCSQR
jgi:hypothetical protein